MPSLNPLVWWRRFLALPNDNALKTLAVAFLVALACSMVVSITAVTLKPMRDANRRAESVARMLGMLEGLGGGLPQPRLVELASGTYVDNDPGTSTTLPPDRDHAGLRSRENVATVFEVRDGGALRLLVLPVRGRGFQSTIKAYLALEPDLNTVAALAVYEQGETPGMGARIAEKDWQAKWRGKQVADDGAIRIEVVKGTGTAKHEVDGISGATRTGNAITQLIRFWLGPDGYGPYLERLRSEMRR